jgi:hypothetical protein
MAVYGLEPPCQARSAESTTFVAALDPAAGRDRSRALPAKVTRIAALVTGESPLRIGRVNCAATHACAAENIRRCVSSHHGCVIS